MTKGYFLHIGDDTTCGGKILTGSATLRFHEIPDARVGDKVTCGKFMGIFDIVGGLPKRRNEGLLLAGTLHSVSSCPCRATFIPSIENGYQKRAVILPELPDLFGGNDPEDEVEQYGQSAKRKKKPEQDAFSTSNEKEAGNKTPPPKKKREITLTIGVFFDGTGNNAINVENMINAVSGEHFDINSSDAQSILAESVKVKKGLTGFGASSYTSYYSNIHWLNILYKTDVSVDTGMAQQAIYIEGIGTDAGKSDSMTGKGLGTSDAGVIAKTDNAVISLPGTIQKAVTELIKNLNDEELIINALEFDIFGFSRGAAAARHFANRVQSEELAIIDAIRTGLGKVEYHGAPAGKTRFIGIFDTVAAIGTPANGLNPHSADTGDVNIVLHPGVAEKVFQITAQNEFRYNFALNSVKPAWPELALPGCHSDIGGGYLPVEVENLFLTRPLGETVLLEKPDYETQVYQQTIKNRELLAVTPGIDYIVRNSEIINKTWFDDKMPQDRYGNFQKRSFAALLLNKRLVKNDWSKVVLRVMLDAAQDAGVLFDPIRETNENIRLPFELLTYCDKAITLGRLTRNGKTMAAFTAGEIELIAKDYIHCSANWDAVETDGNGNIKGGAAVANVIFTNRPDENWIRTEYNMDGKQI
ncbi:hypothetical protein M975_1109 [Buttiauxella brennerae ATCC 51605]|uniref:T6SS Phospholipase effector Tle1-like catalytic domain-containing protein n=1 Tax=Buttiauxella brennerae ATCC 51605 TaxID=1354251 RepID=A0A1B7IS97_9ENTR|nr:DUF2235 domain-containing protein [Buttiauxella brennerae]OAT32672.1 hypothetical protein M975_1109 [Buttiauxella brennerae ATCC 51605]